MKQSALKCRRSNDEISSNKVSFTLIFNVHARASLTTILKKKKKKALIEFVLDETETAANYVLKLSYQCSRSQTLPSKMFRVVAKEHIWNREIWRRIKKKSLCMKFGMFLECFFQNVYILLCIIIYIIIYI